MTKENYIAKYGEKDGIRRWKQNERNKRYYEKHRERKRQYEQERRNERLVYNRNYYATHKDVIKRQNREYKDSHKDYYASLDRKYRAEHQSELREYSSEWSKNNRKKMNGYVRKYHQTKNGRAHRLRIDYQHLDRKKNLGECTLTAKWIVDKIFSSRCIYCGENDWRKLGCDRIDNSKPHTPNNVVCCCRKCNSQRGKKSFYSFKLLHSADFLKII